MLLLRSLSLPPSFPSLPLVQLFIEEPRVCPTLGCPTISPSLFFLPFPSIPFLLFLLFFLCMLSLLLCSFCSLLHFPPFFRFPLLFFNCVEFPPLAPVVPRLSSIFVNTVAFKRLWLDNPISELSDSLLAVSPSSFSIVSNSLRLVLLCRGCLQFS